MVLAHKAKLNFKALDRIKKLHELAFDPVRKCMSIVHLRNNKKEVTIKGAPEIIIGKSKYYLKDGKFVKMSKKEKDYLLEKNHEYASLGLRVLGLGYKNYTGKTFKAHDVESNIVFVGLVAIRDPPAGGVKEAIETAKGAGIKVVMITGDNPITARAIAMELGICTESSKIITGQELDNMSDSDLLLMVNDVSVYARTTPSHKLRIVKLLQKKKNIVAMTGDGVNDSPALKQADIGVAMGGRGTEVAKEASNMVIRDDNFKTIVEAVREGRVIYSNIRKFIYYMLAINLAELSLIALATLFNLPIPLTPLMILFINLITSDILALAIVKESGSPWIMKQKPRDPQEGIVNEYLLIRISQSFPIIALGTFSLFLWELLLTGNLLKAQTIAFTSLILFEVFHAFNSRSFVRSNFTREISGNYVFMIAIILTFLSVFMGLYWAPMQNLLGTVPLLLKDWARILLVTPAILLFVEFQKLIVKSEFKERERLETEL